MNEEVKPLLVVKPKFNPIQYFISKYLLTLIALIFLTIFTLQVYTGENKNIGLYFAIAIFAYIIYIIIRMLIQRKRYKLVQYWFYDDSVLVVNKNKKSKDVAIGYNETIDILMTQTFLQKYYNQGDLILKLSEGKIMAKHLTLIGIPNFSETTKKISQIVYGE